LEGIVDPVVCVVGELDCARDICRYSVWAS
jgi:hypothetical protein